MTLLNGGWQNHPAAKLWLGYHEALRLYLREICLECRRRGFRDNILDRLGPTSDNVDMPKWMGWNSFHASHRSNLLRKDPTWYTQFGWTEHPHMIYLWPESEYNAWKDYRQWVTDYKLFGNK